MYSWGETTLCHQMVQVTGNLEHSMDGYYMVQTKGEQLLLMPSTLDTKPKQCVVCLINDTDKYLTLKHEHCVGVAEKIDTLQEAESTPSASDHHVSNVRVIQADSSHTSSNSEIPDHLKDLFERSINNLSSEESEKLRQVLIEFSDVFAKDDTDLGNFDAIIHRIDTGDARPIKQRMRRTPLGFEHEEEKQLETMLRIGVIQPSVSEWSSPPVLVRKKDGGVRWCIDYRALNEVTRKDVFPLPLIEECIDTLSGTRYFSTLDMASGYWQINLAEEDRHKTAFITKYGLFEHTRMGFGLCNAPATFQRAIQLVLRGLTWKDVLAYLDDVIVVGSDFEHHLKNLLEVLKRCRQYKLKLKPKKCVLFQSQVKFLGRIVSETGIAVNPENIETVKNWPIPKCTRDVEKFLGFINYHREHLHKYAQSAGCLYGLTGKNPFSWNDNCQAAFDDLKQALINAPILAYPNPNDPFILDTDASDHAIGAELLQIQNGVEKVISYGSYVLTPEQRRYCTTRKELLAVIRFTRQYRHYLLGRKFTVRTDHNSLTWLMRFKYIEGQLARWIEELSQYDMTIIHRPGNKHGNADGMSRITDPLEACDCYRAGIDLETLPCGGCAYCERAHKHWSRFQDDVDDVVPLAVRRLNVADDEECGSFWGPSYSKEELRAAQKSDDDLIVIINWLETLDSLDEVDKAKLAMSSATVKYYWLHRKQLQMKDGLLFYRWEQPTGHRLLFVVPLSLREVALQSCHDSISAGHLGQKKTLEKLRRFFIWHGITNSSEEYIKSCATCSLNKRPNVKPKAALGAYHAGFPMERVHIDILGPLPQSRNGNKYILMMVDQFTKWVECAPVPVQSAEVVAKAAVDGFFSRFGSPLQLHSDQGRNFESNLFKEVCDLLEITKTRTTPYRPCSNGQVERYNRTLLQLIRCYIRGNPLTWDEHLPLLLQAINSTVNRQTGYTPNKMMLGREIIQPVEVMLGTAEYNQDAQEPHTFVQKMQKLLPQIHHLARQTLQSSQIRQKRDYDLKLYQTSYVVGDLVYKLDSATKVGQSSKLKSPWKGPYLVTEVLSSTLLRIKDRKRDSVVHHDRLKKCIDRAIPMWLRRMRHKLLDTEAKLPNTDSSTSTEDSIDDSQNSDPDEESNMLYRDEDLGLDKLFLQEEGKCRPKSKSKSKAKNVAPVRNDNVPSSEDSNTDTDTDQMVIFSRRSRPIRRPEYLRRDYV